MVGSGSNLLVSDEGFHGLVMKLAGELTEGGEGWNEHRLRGRRQAALGSREGSRAGGSPASSSG